jgi:hypothetical protein
MTDFIDYKRYAVFLAHKYRAYLHGTPRHLYELEVVVSLFPANRVEVGGAGGFETVEQEAV